MSNTSHRGVGALRLFAGASLVALACSSPVLAGEADGPLAAPQATAQTTNGPSTNVPTTQVPSSGSPNTETEQKATSVPVSTPDGSVSEVVVTGFRSSLRNAIAQKRTSDQIVESISAEDIGKLPDNSIAESIARLPGVTSQRLDGRDSVISIRGLSPDFSTTLLNGREQVSTSGNRSVEFDQYPSELISGVVVYKTPEAGLVGQGLAGTIDLRTIRPLDYKTRIVSFNARGEYDTLDGRDDKGYRVSGTYVDQFANETIGVSFGVAREESPNVSNRWRDYGFSTIAGGALAPGAFVSEAWNGQLERTGANLTLQYRPGGHFSSTLDFYYSDYLNTQGIHGLEQQLSCCGAPLSPGYTVTNGIVTAGTYTGIQSIQRNDLNQDRANLYALGWNGVYEDGPWKVVGDVSFSGVRKREKVVELYSGTGRAGSGPADTLGFNIDPDGSIQLAGNINHADTNLIRLSNEAGWGTSAFPGFPNPNPNQDGYYNSPLVRDQLDAYRLSAIREVGRFGVKSVDVGGNFTHRFKSYDANEYILALSANLADPKNATTVAYPANALGDPLSLGFVGLGDVVNADPEQLLKDGLYSYGVNQDPGVFAKSWKVREDVSTVWLKANIDQPVAGGDLTGNAGLQLVYTDQQSAGLASTLDGSNLVQAPIVGGDTYLEPLPSINLNYRLTTGDVVRGGLARTLARARMDDLNASKNFSYSRTLENSTDPNNSPFSINAGGNPKLHPWIADSADLSVEHYFGRDAYVSLAAYYKYLETYIYNQTTQVDFTGYPVPAGQNPAERVGNTTIPVNGSGGNLYGLEATAVLPLSTLTGFVDHEGRYAPYVDGFGLSGSISWTESTITQGTQGVTALPGLSKWVGNGTAYYEKNGFSARISVRYRSKYLSEVSGFGDSRDRREGEAETITDAQIGYTWTQGPLKGLGVLLQGNNLTNEPFITFEASNYQRILDNQEYGQRILFGISYKY